MSDLKQHARDSFKGVWTAITSPFTDSLELDEEGLRRNVQYVADEMKVEGIFCTGVMGEFWSLTREERKRAIEIVIQEARGRCLVNAHTGHSSVRETIHLTEFARDAGADFCIIITPYYPVRSQDGIYEWWKAVAQGVEGIGLWMFDGPYTGAQMMPETAARIAELDNVVGLKQAWPIDLHDEYHKRLHDKLVLSQPDEGVWLRLMRDYGQQVHMSSPSPYLMQRPGWLPMHEYTQLGLAGDFEAAEAISESEDIKAVRKLRGEWINSRAGTEGILPIAWVKAWSELLGMAAGPVRPPLVNLTQADRNGLRAALESTRLLELQRA